MLHSSQQFLLLLVRLLVLLLGLFIHQAGRDVDVGEEAEAAVRLAEGLEELLPNAEVAHPALCSRSLNSSISLRWWPSPYQHVSILFLVLL